MDLYYIKIDEQKRGPYTLDQLRSMWRVGQITVETPCCDAGKENWTKLLPIASQFDVSPRMVVSDFDMPFGNMILFIFKWALATIPALLMLTVIWYVLFALLDKMCVHT
ncbi:MAG: DUF4339 domain-containing protein [Chthoniobacterales bacterium]